MTVRNAPLDPYPCSTREHLMGLASLGFDFLPRNLQGKSTPGAAGHSSATLAPGCCLSRRLDYPLKTAPDSKMPAKSFSLFGDVREPVVGPKKPSNSSLLAWDNSTRSSQNTQLQPSVWIILLLTPSTPFLLLVVFGNSRWETTTTGSKLSCEARMQDGLWTAQLNSEAFRKRLVF